MKYLFLVLVLILLGNSPAVSSDMKSSLKDEWANPRSWPVVTTIEGKEVKLEMLRRTQVDVSRKWRGLPLKMEYWGARFPTRK